MYSICLFGVDPLILELSYRYDFLSASAITLKDLSEISPYLTTTKKQSTNSVYNFLDVLCGR